MSYRNEWLSVVGTMALAFGSGCIGFTPEAADALSDTLISVDAPSPDAGTSGPDISGNHLPHIGAVIVLPDGARIGTPLTCVWSGFSDADGDPDQSIVAWEIDGKHVSDGPTLEDGFVGGDLVRCVVTPFDGKAYGAPVGAQIRIGNSAPSASGARIEPAVPTADATLTCTAEGWVDPDGDADVSQVTWLANGTVVGIGSSLSGDFRGGDVVSCVLTPYDGQDTGAPVDAQVTVLNSPPALDSASILPEAPTADDTLLCAWSGYVDQDGDPDVSAASWAIAGVPAGSGPSLGGGFVRGDEVTCTVTPRDAHSQGVPVLATTTITNAPPRITDVHISPSPVEAGSEATCATVGFTDSDGDADQSTFAWLINGLPVGDTAVLSVAVVDGDQVTCVATPSDGLSAGAPVTRSVQVGNAAPSVGWVAITPTEATAGDKLTCSYGGYADDDGDLDQSRFEWRVNGKLVAFGPALFSKLAMGDDVRCEVVPFDGHSEGARVSAELTVGNSQPWVSGVVISPGNPTFGDAVTCGWDQFHDADGHSDQSVVRWFVQGEEVGLGDTLGAGFSQGDRIDCRVEPYDGFDPGDKVTATVVVGNHPPALTGATVIPASPTAGDTLSCSGQGFSDADGDADGSRVRWRVNGQLKGDTSTLAGVFQGGDLVTCEVTPWDGKSTGLPVLAQVTVQNRPPSLVSATVTPATPQAGDVLTCSGEGFYDADGAIDQSHFAWTINDTPVGTGPTLAADLARGDLVRCVVTPFDGQSEGPSVESVVTVVNTVPTVAAAVISPAAPAAGDPISCAADGFADADADADQSLVRWTLNGADAGTGGVLQAAPVAGDVVGCRITAFDGFDAGPDVSVSVTLLNTPPVLEAVGITPELLHAGDEARCEATGPPDVDGQDVTLVVGWTLNGEAAGATDTLTGFVAGDTLVCSAAPFDGIDMGTALSATAVVANTAPTLQSAAISPAAPTELDPLTCTWTGFADADGHPDASTVAWRIAGVVVGTETTLNGVAQPGDVVTCEVTPFDGLDAGPPVSAQVPVIAYVEPGVAISPAVATATDTLTCTPSGLGDAAELSWFVDGQPAGSGTSLAGVFVRGALVECVGTPAGGGEPQSASLTIANSQPTIDASLAPGTVRTNDVLTVTASGSDMDGNPVAITFAWWVDGELLTVTGATLDGASWFDEGQTVTVRVSASDGAGGTAEWEDAVTIANSAPGAPEIAVQPQPWASSNEDLSCAVVVDAWDPDGDALTYTFKWTVDGAPWAGEIPVVPAAATGSGQLWACQVNAHDESAGGSAAVAEVQVQLTLSGDLSGIETLENTGVPVLLTGDVEVNQNNKLTIEPGVHLIGGGFELLVDRRGELVIGGDGEMTVLEDVHITGFDTNKDDPGEENDVVIKMINTHVIGGSFHTGADLIGDMAVERSVFEDVQGAITCWQPLYACVFTDNIFIRSGGISLWLASGVGDDLVVENNVFIEQTTPFALEKLGGWPGRDIILDNQFLSTDRVAVRIPVGSTSDFKVRSNWWGTTDPALIETMIVDSVDGQNSGTVLWSPVLNQPPALGPDWSPWLD